MISPSCRTLRFALDATPFALKPPENAIGCAQPEGHTANVLRCNGHFAGNGAEIDPAPLTLTQNPLQRAKMSVQIETPVDEDQYKHADMSVNNKSALIAQNLRALGARIRAIRTAKGLNQTDFARLFSVTQVAVSNWEKGVDRPGAKALMELAKLTADPDLRDYFVRESGFTELFMNFGRSERKESTESEIRQIPLLKDSVAAGTPRATNEKEIAQMLAFPRAWFRSPGELYALRVAGDSMSPVIGDGYIVIVDVSKRDPKKLVEHMVAAREGDGVTIKWLRRDGDTYLLVPQHVTPRHPVRIMRAEGNFSIVGEVIKWIGEPPPVRR